MKTPPATLRNVLEIRKYSNRRFYNPAHSRHLTLEEIHNLVKAGHEVRVVDNRTSADITAKVLAQIILDRDAPKLDLFPAAIFAEIIRVNDQLLKGLYEKIFHQALREFRHFQKAFESRLEDKGALPSMFPPITAWTQAMVKPFGFGDTEPGENRDESPPSRHISATLADLQRQLAILQTEFARSKKSTPRRSRSKQAK